MSEPFGAGQRVAFFGGSFDPPHRGHLAVAHAAVAALPLDVVLFAPVGSQPFKPKGSTADFNDRVDMTRLAIAEEPAFRLSLADAPKAAGDPNYTLETLQAVKSQLAENSALYCLMGADSFSGLRQWFRAAEIPFTAPLIVASRPGQPLDDLKALLPSGLVVEDRCKFEPRRADREKAKIELRCYTIVSPAGEQAPFYVLPDLDIPISASEIRQAIAASANAKSSTEVRELLTEPVAEYIRSRGLYC